MGKKPKQKALWHSGRLTVEVLKGKQLLAADKSGTSDPFVTVQLVDVNEGNPLKSPHDKVAKTGVAKKTLTPEWKGEKFVFDDVPHPLPRLRFTVQDYNGMLSKPKPLGRAHVSLEAIWEMTHKTALPAQWLSLKPYDALKETTGAIEVRVNLTPSSGDERQDAIDEAESSRWFPDDEDEDAESRALRESREPNTLLVAVVRAKDLRAMDKALFGGKSSDPFVTLSVGVEGKQVKSRVIKKDLQPVWSECLEVPLPRTGARGAFLTVRVDDADMMGSDYMGGCAVDLSDLPPALEDGSRAGVAKGRDRLTFEGRLRIFRVSECPQLLSEGSSGAPRVSLSGVSRGRASPRSPLLSSPLGG